VRIIGSIRLYCGFAAVAIREAMIHRAQFWAGIIAQWLSYGTTFATLYIVVARFNALAGWSAHEVLFMFAMNLLTYALAAMFFFNPCIRLAAKIRTGEFDAALTKPVSPFAHEVYQGFNAGYVSHVTLSVSVMIYAIHTAKLAVTPSALLLLLLLIIGAALLQAALLVGVSAMSFLLRNDNPLFHLLWDIKGFTNYPLSIYGVFIQVMLTLVLPVAFINFYPTAALFRLDTGTPFGGAWGFLTPLVGLSLFLLSVRLWNACLSKYQSAGS